MKAGQRLQVLELVAKAVCVWTSLKVAYVIHHAYSTTSTRPAFPFTATYKEEEKFHLEYFRVS